MCNACFEDKKIKTFTTFTVEYEGCIVVICNVPCLECQICGENTFADEISAQLERIVDSVKTVLPDISVIDYSKVVYNPII